MTYSIVARCPDTGALGVAVQSHFFGVGRMVVHARAGVGAVATQASVEYSYGSRGLGLMAGGRSARETLRALLADDPDAGVRQVAMMDVHGRVDAHTGDRCVAQAGHLMSTGVSVQANMMVSDTVCAAMVAGFESATGDLADRLLAALDAAEAEGGDARGRQSAAMLVVAGAATGDYRHDVLVDLRVDDHPNPLGELRRLAEMNEAFAGFLALLAAPGLMAGDAAVDDETARDALRQLDRMQVVAGPGNLEPTVWKGVVLARTGHLEQAAEHFERATRSHSGFVPFLVSLRQAGYLPGGS